jgi:hypothetical protein
VTAPRRIDLDAAMELARLCEQASDTDEEFELASRTVPALVAEVRYWRNYAKSMAAGQVTS